MQYIRNEPEEVDDLVSDYTKLSVLAARHNWKKISDNYMYATLYHLHQSTEVLSRTTSGFGF